MKTQLIFLFVACFKIAGAQDTLAFDGLVGAQLDRKAQREAMILLYADSLNTMKKKLLPKFAMDPCFDLTKSLWSGLHNPEPIRWKILQKVTNRKALRMILKCKNPALDSICTRKDDFNWDVDQFGLSFRSLTRKRLEQIK